MLMEILAGRRLVLVFALVSAILGAYVLCVALQIQVPWQMGPFSRPHIHLLGHPDKEPASRSVPQNNEVIAPFASDVVSGSVPFEEVGQTTAATGSPRLPPSGFTTLSEVRDGSSPPPPTTTKATTTAKQPDFFGDYYTNDVQPPQSKCPDSIRTRVGNSSFSSKFLGGSIPVLQWAKDATERQYQRLRNFPGTHGWGGISFSLLQESLSVLNTSANRMMFDDWDRRGNGSQCIRCAVVGNGGILKGSGKGPEIDQHHYVFRTNGAVLTGFETDVGTRTNFYTFSTNTLRNSMRSYHGLGYNGPPLTEETRYVFLPDHDRDYILMRASALHLPIETGPERTSTPPKYFGENPSVEKFKMYHPDFVRYLRNRFLRSSVLNGKYKNIYRPSTGAVMLLAALHTCDQVSAYGFMTPDYKNYSNHYYDSSFQGVGFYANHDYRLEMALWQELHKAGLINLYMRN